MSKFRKGSEAAADAGKGGAQFAKTHFFSLDSNPASPENTGILRFLTDEADWIVVDQHNSIPTKGKPADYEGTSWPDKMGAVCRADVAYTGQYHDGTPASAKAACFICSNLVGKNGIKKAGGRTWALACEREEVKGDGSPEMGGPEMQGKVLGYRDKTRQVAVVGEDGKPTGDEVTERAIVVVNMGYKNFFAALTGFATHYKTALDRDYFIKRKGSDTDTIYQIIPLDPVPHEDGTIFDCRKPEHAAKYGVSLEMLEEIVDERASDEFYARFFDTTKTAAPLKKAGDKGGSTAAATPAAEKDNDVTEDRLAALASRVKGVAAPAAPTPAGGAPSTAGEAAEAPAETPAETPAPAPVAAGMRNFD